MLEFVAPTAAHIGELVANLRQADRVELDSGGHFDYRHCIGQSLAMSSHAVTALDGGRVVAVFGVVPLSILNGVGSPWMLGTDLVTRRRRALMQHAPAYIRTMLRAYPHLVNLVHADNQFAVRWLQRVGFVLHPAEPHPATGALFHRFEMKA